MKQYAVFCLRAIGQIFSGSGIYFVWLTLLSVLVICGAYAYATQLAQGLAVTGMSDQVSWGVYIANFTFLVGMAAAAVMMVIPAYLYDNKDLKDVVLLGELLAIACIIMCIAFVTVDVGRPDRLWHMLPGIGKFHFPQSMLAWDVIALSGYLLLNAHICGYNVYCRYLGYTPKARYYIPFIFISIVWAISIHTVTAFLYNGLGGRPFWNSAIVAPRFLASAFAAGPGFLILTLQLIRKYANFPVKDGAIDTLRKIITIAMIINLFLLGCEVFKEFYTDSAHLASARYLFLGLHGYSGLVPWIWSAIFLNVSATVILLIPRLFTNVNWLNLACCMAFVGIWVEKGMGLIIPAFIPTPLGEVLEYSPSWVEVLVSLGIWALGFLIYTFFLKMVIPIYKGELRLVRETTT
jgi:Ni/Fe-hydrogenase subunit HybB-like protein